MKIIFFGTPTFSCPFLKALIDEKKFNVVCVVTQPDKQVGRGKNLTPSPIKVLAMENGLPVVSPESLRRDLAAVEDLKKFAADIFVVVAYGKLLPPAVLQIPKLGVVNVHPSLLPRHRGPSPMQGTILSGDAQGGVSVMLLDEGMDTGPILASEPITIDSDETYECLEEKVKATGTRLLVETLKRHACGDIVPMRQDESKATLTKLLAREDGHVDWSEPMDVIERKHRAFGVWPGLWCLVRSSDDSTVRIKLIRMRLTDLSADLPAGTISIKKDRVFVSASNGTLEILELQPEGKPKMSASAFIAGHPDIDGTVLT
jgi:methionyl-tRNA formyltransferase